jgi:hypothetical protein
VSAEDPARRLEHFRHRTLRELDYQHRVGRLTDDEHARRAGLARRAASTMDLRPLISDLAAEGASVPAAPPGHGPTPRAAGPAGSRSATVPTTRQARSRSALDPGHSDLVLGILGGAVRDGAWRPAPVLDAVGLMGGVKLDFREAILEPGITRVRALAVMGGVAIIVPPDVEVTVKGFGLMGAVGPTPRTDPPPGAPCIHVDGIAFMGGVDVRVRARDADDPETAGAP